MRSGTVAERAGVNQQTLRYYERRGLLEKPLRSSGGHRLYSEHAVTHLGVWLGHAPTGRRFENVDEVYFFTFQEGLIVRAWGLEGSLDRLRQLGLTPC